VNNANPKEIQGLYNSSGVKTWKSSSPHIPCLVWATNVVVVVVVVVVVYEFDES
jgi:hypothetical protein